MTSKRTRPIAAVLLATTLGVTAVPAHARRGGGQDVDFGAGEAGGKAIGRALVIGLGITAGVLVLAGGTAWYFIARRGRAANRELPPDAGRDPVAPQSAG
jgi:hypothetical protein